MPATVRFVRNVDIDESEDTVLSSGGYLHGIHAVNNNSSVLYLKLYDSTSVTVGTTTPVAVFGIPGSGGFTRKFDQPVHFNSGLTVAAVTGAADSSTGAPSANDVVATFDVSGT